MRERERQCEDVCLQTGKTDSACEWKPQLAVIVRGLSMKPAMG